MDRPRSACSLALRLSIFVVFSCHSLSVEKPPTCCQSVSDSFQLVSFPVDFNPDFVLLCV